MPGADLSIFFLIDNRGGLRNPDSTHSQHGGGGGACSVSLRRVSRIADRIKDVDNEGLITKSEFGQPLVSTRPKSISQGSRSLGFGTSQKSG